MSTAKELLRYQLQLAKEGYERSFSYAHCEGLPEDLASEGEIQQRFYLSLIVKLLTRLKGIAV